MKQYKLEPTSKKSLLEYTVWRKTLENGKDVIAILETGWRWGSFAIHVPETEKEIIEWANVNCGNPDYYQSIEEVFNDYAVESVEEFLTVIMPDPNLEFHEMNDYNAEMIETWDGCWEDWSIRTGWTEDAPVLDDVDELIEEVDEAYAEEYEDGVEALGWTFQTCEYEMHCKPMITPIDENGEEIGEPMMSEE